MLVTLAGTVIESNSLHPENAEPPILVTLAGMSIDCKALQPENASSLILVTPSGIITDVKLKQFAKALYPIVIIRVPVSFSTT